MTNSRANPSPRYVEMMEQYRLLHASGERHRHLSADETYPGISLVAHVPRIKALIERTGASDILDYGAGKGVAYALSALTIPGVGRIEGIVDYWDVDSVHCYDPCHEPYSQLPQGKFDGVITTDVLEHCPEQDVQWVIDELFGYARKFVFASIADYPALTKLPNGENAHCTVRPAAWWQQLFESTAAHATGVRWMIVVQSIQETPQGPRLLERECSG